MNTISRTITGIAAIILGLFLFMMPFFNNEKGSFFIWFYAIPILIVGLYILFNTREDKIELRKDERGGRSAYTRGAQEPQREARTSSRPKIKVKGGN
jgi:hypothetical protein